MLIDRDALLGTAILTVVLLVMIVVVLRGRR